ncbi:hypothetical protein M8C21_013681, partial [Ambrosia artemisiifolia]
DLVSLKSHSPTLFNQSLNPNQNPNQISINPYQSKSINLSFMAQNQQPGFFNPSSSSPPPPPNPNTIPYPPPSSAASYPPPSLTNPYSYPPPSPLYHISPPPFHPPSNLHHHRSVPYPTPPLQPPSPNPNFNPNPNPNHGARLMELLSTPPPTEPSVPIANSIQSTNPMVTSSGLHSGSGPLRMSSSKIPKGRVPGEVQPQLEVTPITKYGSDPGLVFGRQIAVNKSYICYGLKLGAIRVLNINTALRSLLKGLGQRVTDMAFFAEDVHLLASASMDGRVYVWKIMESKDEEDKPQITGNIVVAIQVVGEGESVHPRVCWHCHKQEVLVVGVGKRVLRIDTTKVGRGEVYSSEEPLICSVDKLINGVQLVGSHDGEVTDLSMCQWMTTRLVSASVDGTIKIWEDRKSSPIAVLRPHDGLPVSSATFLTAPHRPDHIILITGGPLNHEVKIWASEGEEGWLLPSDADSWHCLQTLELKSSSESRLEDAFFNQVVALSQTGLLLLANAKKNAIYVVHLEYGPNPESTRMDYIAEFTVTMPILSFTGTSDLLPHGEQVVQVYCVQTQAIQQYALDMSQCLPPPIDNSYERQDSSISRDAPSTEGLNVLEPSRSKTETSLEVSVPTSDGASISRQPSSSPLTEASMESPPVASSPTLTRKLSDLKSPVGVHDSNELKTIEYSEALKSSIEASGMIEHTTTAQQQIESAHSPLAIALRDAINSASSVTQTLSGELAESQRKLVALALAGTNREPVNPLITQISNGPIGSFHEKIEAPVDPTKELSRLVYEHKYEEAFTAALQRSDVRIVSWLCSQLACDIVNDTSKKLAWMMDVVVAIKPSDALIAMHVRPIFDQ